MRYLLVLAIASACASAPVIPSAEHPKSGCYLSCADGRSPSPLQRQCVGGWKLRGKDISIDGEGNDSQDPHASFFLAGKGDERAKYPKDDVVPGTCLAFFEFVRHDVNEHQIGVLRSAEHQ
jgi:hypothetical protein